MYTGTMWGNSVIAPSIKSQTNLDEGSNRNNNGRGTEGRKAVTCCSGVEEWEEITNILCEVCIIQVSCMPVASLQSSNSVGECPLYYSRDLSCSATSHSVAMGGCLCANHTLKSFYVFICAQRNYSNVVFAVYNLARLTNFGEWV